jgi:hypothetical protein
MVSDETQFSGTGVHDRQLRCPKSDLTMRAIGANVELAGGPEFCEAIKMFYNKNGDPEPDTFGEVAVTCIFAVGWVAILLLTLNLVR